MASDAWAYDSLQIPKPLSPGDRVGIISPSSWVKRGEIQEGLKILRSFNFEITIPDETFLRHRYLAGEDPKRARSLNSLFADPHIKAIFCTRGGYGSLRILEGIDYGLIRENPKILVGYSDVTALLMAVFKHSGLMVFHGPMLKVDGNLAPLRQMLRYLISPRSIRLRIKEEAVILWGRLEGRLIGGNLTVLSHLICTQYFPPLKGMVLFLEDIKEPLYRIDRALTHLRLSGLLKGLRGILLGDFLGCGPKREIRELFRDLASSLEIPCIGGIPIGHGNRNITLPLGAFCYMDDGTLVIEPWHKMGPEDD